MSGVDLRGKRVFIRADLNVPIEGERITDDTRIRASVPAIETALKAGAAVMVTSHLGRPKEGQFDPNESLAPVARRLSELLEKPVALERNWLDGIGPALTASRAPTRIVWGTGDPIFSTAGAEHLDRAFGVSRGVRRVEGAKLFFPEEFPDLVAEEARRLWGA